MKSYGLITIIAIAVLSIMALFFISQLLSSTQLQNKSPLNSNMSTNYTITVQPTPVIIKTIAENYSNSDNLQPIDGDLIFNSINWSRYPTISKIRVHSNEISEPTYVINHTFLYFTIDVDVKDPENIRELFHEMAGVAVEIRQMIGSNSSIEVWGIVDGFDRYCIVTLPYDDRIYASDHYHPQAYKNDIYLIPGDDIYDYHNYTLINNSVVEP